MTTPNPASRQTVNQCLRLLAFVRFAHPPLWRLRSHRANEAWLSREG